MLPALQDVGHRQLLAAAKDTPEQAGGRFAIPIRTTANIPEQLKRLLDKAELGTLTRDDLKGLRQQDVEAFLRELFTNWTCAPLEFHVYAAVSTAHVYAGTSL